MTRPVLPRCVTAALTALIMCLAAVPPAAAADALPAEYDGSMRTFDFAAWQQPQVPDSLTPFHVLRVARHGARFLSSAKKVEAVNAALDYARSRGRLTKAGKRLQRLLQRVTAVTDGRWGALDSIGFAEQDSLAALMSADWPGVCASGVVKAEATWVPRVVMSMYSFCHRLGALNPDLDIYTAEGHVFDRLLRFYDTDPLYVSYLHDKPWKEYYDAWVQANVPARPASALVGDALNENELRQLTLDLYGVLQSLRATGMGVPTTEWMSEAEYRDCWQAANLNHYYARTISPEGVLPAVAAIPLLRAVMADGDAAVEALRHGDMEVMADLWFGHAETLMPLTALMDLDGCVAPGCEPAQVADRWRDCDIVPLGAFVEVTLLHAPSGAVYALTRLNGRDTPVAGMAAAVAGTDTRTCRRVPAGAIVPWAELRSFWSDRMAALLHRL